jgi:hypothetical protein
MKFGRESSPKLPALRRFTSGLDNRAKQTEEAIAAGWDVTTRTFCPARKEEEASRSIAIDRMDFSPRLYSRSP